MARPPLRLTNLPVAALGLAVAGLGGAALTLANSDAVVEHGFNRALAEMADRPDGTRAGIANVAGSERFWLTHVVHDATPPLAKPVTIGDHITIGSGAGERVLRVVDVNELDNRIIPSSAERPARMLLVTCRDEGNPEGRAVRLVIDAEDALPAPSAAKTPRAL